MVCGALTLTPISQLVDYPAAVVFVPDDPVSVEARLQFPWPCLRVGITVLVNILHASNMVPDCGSWTA